MTEKEYEVNQKPSRTFGWCGYRFLLIIGVIVSVIIYTTGAIVTGIVFRSWNHEANCTAFEPDYKHTKLVEVQKRFEYNTPLVVVGPCFMAVGGALITFMIFQWSFCRPIDRR